MISTAETQDKDSYVYEQKMVIIYNLHEILKSVGKPQTQLKIENS